MAKIDTVIFDYWNTLCNAEGWLPGADRIVEDLSRRCQLIVCSMSSYEELETGLASHFSLFKKVYSREFMAEGKTLAHFRREFPTAHAIMIGNKEDMDAVLSDPQTPLLCVDDPLWATRGRANLILQTLGLHDFDEIYGSGSGSRCVTLGRDRFRFSKNPLGLKVIEERP